MKIGLCLSGGGFRATTFHLGVLARLAESDHLKDVTHLSTVSGGSLCAGSVFAANDYRWPTALELQEHVIPHMRQLLLEKPLHGSLARVLFTTLLGRRPHGTGADDLARDLRDLWEIRGTMGDLPDTPKWVLNATTYETGKNWRFSKDQMGDYLFRQQVKDLDAEAPGVLISDAMAASAGFPIVVGPLVFEIKGHTLHLWDGGVYDNLGTEAVVDFRNYKPLKSGVDIDFLIISDASGRLLQTEYTGSFHAKHVMDLAKDQIESLRSRLVIEHFNRGTLQGSYLQTGNTCQQVLESAADYLASTKKRMGTHSEELSALTARYAEHSEQERANLSTNYLPDGCAQAAADFETRLERLEPEEFTLLFQHGFEVADYTMYAYHKDEFQLLGYDSTRWMDEFGHVVDCQEKSIQVIGPGGPTS